MSLSSFILEQLAKEHDFYLEKLAAGDSQVTEELRLIERYQKYNDPFALSRLTQMFQGTIAKTIRGSGVTSVISEDVAYQEALNKFKTIISRYDLSQTKAKPNSYITSSLQGEMQKVRDRYSGSAVKMSEPLRGYNRSLFIAENMLKAQNDGKEPTSKELFSFMRKELGLTGQKLNANEIEKILKYRTKDLSSSAVIGQTNADGAEELTFADVNNSLNLEDEYNKKLEEESIISKIQQFSDKKKKRALLMKYFGLGEFKNRKANSKNEAALTVGASYYEGTKIISDFIKYLKESPMV